MISNQSIIREILGAQISSKSVRAQAILSVIENKEEEEQVELLSICFIERDTARKHNSRLKNLGLTNDEWNEFIVSHHPMIVAHLKNVFFKIRTVQEFAKQVIKLLNFYDSTDEKIFCLGACLFSEYIPFHELPGDRISMNKERFGHLVSVNKDRTELIDYLIKLPFFSYSDEASHLLFLLDEIGDNQELRVSMLAYYIIGRDEINRKKE